jgi:hypothetical protein
MALAGSFADDGTFLFDPAAVVALDFEDDQPSSGITTLADEKSLSGKSVMPLDPFGGADVAVDLPAKRRTYRVTAWIRDSETIADLELFYSDRVDEVVTLYPTGRVTSDGWVELGNERVRVDGPRLKHAQVGFFSPDGAAVDALEIVPDGDPSEPEPEPNRACRGATDAVSCGVGQMCVYSECRNVNGWVPPIPRDREQVTDYLEARIKLLFGPVIGQAIDTPASLVYIERMRAATDPFTYWNGFMTALRRLHDGHTTTSGLPDFILQNPRPLSVCFLEGDADLTHATAPKDPEYLDVLVSHTGHDHTLGLNPGDRLVRVDGQHPIAWARGLIEHHWTLPRTSNPHTFAELTAYVRSLISRYAETIEVIRCDKGSGTCGQVETISIGDIPLEPLAEPAGIACDNRPLRHLDSSPDDHATGDAVYSGIVKESNATERIYGLEWESLYTTTGQDGVGSALHAAVDTWEGDARGVILDHRTGFGGTIMAPEILWNFSVPRHLLDTTRERAFGEAESFTPEEVQAIVQRAVDAGFAEYAGSDAPNLDVPVALLITQDVSASDWLPAGIKGAPNTKIFGPFQTNGAFSTRYSFGYWLGMSYLMATGDTFLPDGTTHNGRGVEPDVVVLPRQSDLLIGKDTVYEAAIAWVRQGLAQ